MKIFQGQMIPAPNEQLRIHARAGYLKAKDRPIGTVAAAGRETRDGGFIYLLSLPKSGGRMIAAFHPAV